MALIIQIAQIISAILLTVLILMQNRGAGLSATFGGSGGFYATKRGAEKIISVATIVTAVLFLVLSFAASVVS